MSWFELKTNETEEVLDDSSIRYVLEMTILSSGGIDKALFTFRTVDSFYSHPATVHDLNSVPASKALAEATHADFYRSDKLRMSFRTTRAAAEARDGINARLRYVNRQWARFQVATVGGETVNVYDSDNP